LPHPASRLAEVGERNAREAVTGRLQKHPLEQYAFAGLHVGARGDCQARSAQALGELIANALELTQVEHARFPGDAGATLEPAHPVRGHEGFRQITLEPRDLSAEGAARGAFVNLPDCRRQLLRSGWALL
jgi:hypothetical protein